MGQIGLNVHAALMQNGSSNKKLYTASKDGMNSFDRILANKVNESNPQKTNINNSGSNKTMKNPSGAVNKPKQDSVETEEDPESRKDTNKKSQQFADEVLSMIQSLEEMMQQIDMINWFPDKFNCEDFQDMMNSLKIQINEVLTGAEGVNLKSLQGMLLEVMDALEEMDFSNQFSLKTDELEGMLLKLKDTVGQQLDENIHGFTRNSSEIHRNGLFNNIDTGDETDIKQLDEKTTNIKESHMDNQIQKDEAAKDSNDSLEQGFEKQKGFFSGMKSNIEKTNSPQQTETQYVQLEQTNMVEQIKTETTVTQPVKLSNIIDQIASKAIVQLGEDASEMSLQLKPENLGKLTMKVSIERGIVVATFVVESQVVKEVLESNFNILKDALEEKGLAVQELNVFVGSDSHFHQQKNQMDFQRKMNKKNSSYSDNSYGNGMEEVAQVASKSLNSSKLDFFA